MNLIFALILAFAALKLFEWFLNHGKKAEDLTCPVCGYYCLGKGGVGCIDKLKKYQEESNE